MKRARTYGMKLLDATLYGLGVFGVAILPIVLLSFTLGRNWTGVKTALFLLWLVYGVAGTWKLRPQPREEFDIDDPDSGDDDGGGGSRFGLGIGRAFGFGGGRRIGDEEDLDRTGVESDALESSSMSDAETGFGALVHRVPPASLLPFPPEMRASAGLRFLGASAVMFVVSFTMEAVFRVGYPGGPA